MSKKCRFFPSGDKNDIFIVKELYGISGADNAEVFSGSLRLL